MAKSKFIGFLLIILGLMISFLPMYIVSEISTIYEDDPNCNDKGEYIGEGFVDDYCYTFTDHLISNSPLLLIGVIVTAYGFKRLFGNTESKNK